MMFAIPGSGDAAGVPIRMTYVRSSNDWCQWLVRNGVPAELLRNILVDSLVQVNDKTQELYVIVLSVNADGKFYVEPRNSSFPAKETRMFKRTDGQLIEAFPAEGRSWFPTESPGERHVERYCPNANCTQYAVQVTDGTHCSACTWYYMPGIHPRNVIVETD